MTKEWDVDRSIPGCVLSPVLIKLRLFKWMNGVFARLGFKLTWLKPSPHPVGPGAIADDGEALALAEDLAAYLSRQGADFAQAVFSRHDFHLLRKHFYLPIPESADIECLQTAPPSALTAVDMNDAAGLELFSREFPPSVREFCSSFPLYRRRDQALHESCLINDSYMAVDACVYYVVIRSFKLRRIVEIGAGSSTLLAGAALLANQAETGQPAELTAVEPFPSKALQQGFPRLTRLITAKVHDVDLGLFTSLQGNDILFIDSSHVLHADGDVQLDYLEILPRLAPGVLVQAFLAFNSRFEVFWPGNYFVEKYPERMNAAFPEFKVMRQHLSVLGADRILDASQAGERLNPA